MNIEVTFTVYGRSVDGLKTSALTELAKLDASAHWYIATLDIEPYIVRNHEEGVAMWKAGVTAFIIDESAKEGITEDPTDPKVIRRVQPGHPPIGK